MTLLLNAHNFSLTPVSLFNTELEKIRCGDEWWDTGKDKLSNQDFTECANINKDDHFDIFFLFVNTPQTMLSTLTHD